MRSLVALRALLGGLLLVWSSTALAQLGALSDGPFPGLKDAANGPDSTGGVITVSAEIKPPTGKEPAKLSITAKIAPGWHTYSLTQKPGGPTPTTIKLAASPDYRVGTFRSLEPAKSSREPLFNNLSVESHEGEVTWQAPIEFSEGVDPKSVSIGGSVEALACADAGRCLPGNYPFQIGTPSNAQAMAQSTPPARGGPIVATGSFRAPHAVIRGRIEPRVATPGSTAKLVLTVEPAEGWHVYALADRDPEEVFKPTLIQLTETSKFGVKRAAASIPPTERKAADPIGGTERFHTTPVSWTVEIEVPKDAQPGTYPIVGLIGYQTCTDRNCDTPRALQFDAALTVSNTAAASRPDLGFAALAFREASYSEVAKVAKGAAELAANSGSGSIPAHYQFRSLNAHPETTSLPLILLFSLLGGLLLNLMPCVLPVIGLKILSFAEQAGRDRKQILALNLWYSAGLIVVFMVLASLSVFAHWGWGEQFTSTGFNVTIAGLVFIMALSFLGVWEIPIPGFVGSGKAADLAAQEGASGAFAKGVFTTVLATPCSGPFLGTVFGFTLNQPPYIVYVIFACIGLGMASPYLLVGAFPSLVRFLPKPGAWMDTFKQVMGFMLLGTVVYLFTFLHPDYVLPTFGLLVGLWAACWWIGRTPLTADTWPKLRSWSQAVAFASIVGLLAFRWLGPGESVLPWKAFSEPALAELTGEGKTVMVDITANWCPNCKWNLKTAIDTEEVRKAIEANDVVPLLADWTRPNPEIKKMLDALSSDSIPILAIFPAGHPNEPIVLRDVITRSQLLRALKEAGPSLNTQSDVASQAGSTAEADAGSTIVGQGLGANSRTN